MPPSKGNAAIGILTNLVCHYLQTVPNKKNFFAKIFMNTYSNWFVEEIKSPFPTIPGVYYHQMQTTQIRTSTVAKKLRPSAGIMPGPGYASARRVK